MLFAPALSLLPAVVFRASRCSDSDLAALQNTWMKVTAPQPTEGRPGISVVAEFINDFSELWFVPDSYVEGAEAVSNYGCGWMRGIADAALFGSVLRTFSSDGCYRRAQSGDLFQFTPDQYWLQYPSVDIPVLLMNSEFDQTIPHSWARHAETGFSRRGSTKATLVQVPRSGHTPTGNSPTTYGGVCGIDMAASFVMLNGSPVTACLDQILPLNFNGSAPYLTTFYLGTTDAWN